MSIQSVLSPLLLEQEGGVTHSIDGRGAASASASPVASAPAGVGPGRRAGTDLLYMDRKARESFDYAYAPGTG